MRLLHTLLAALVAALSLVVLSAGPSFACSCVFSGTADYVERAEVVVTGTVTAITPPPRRLVMSSMDPNTYTVAVDEVLKGDAGDTVDVLSPMSGASCGLENVMEGRRYVVFASHQSMEGRDDDNLWANLCGGTAEATPELVEDVRSVTGADPNPAAEQGAVPEADGAAGTSDPVSVGEDPVAAGATSAEGGSLAAPMALVAGVALTLLAGVLWLRLVLRR